MSFSLRSYQVMLGLSNRTCQVCDRVRLLLEYGGVRPQSFLLC